MSTYRPAQIFASIASDSKLQRTKVPSVEELASHLGETTVVKPSKTNEITVTSTGELSQAPDRCKVTITVKTRKEQVQDAKNSVSRRMDYITQTLQNHQVKEGDINTSKLLRRVDGMYHLDAEVTVVFVDFAKCQAVCNFLVEKLDESVRITTPEFYQSPQRLENLRRQTSLLAVSNAKQKAGEIAKFLHATVGRPVSIREESCSEWEGVSEAGYDPEAPVTLQQRRDHATAHVNVKVSATFELKVKAKTKVQPNTDS